MVREGEIPSAAELVTARGGSTSSQRPSKGVSDLQRFDFGRLLDELTLGSTSRRDKIVKVKRQVLMNQYETPGKLRIALSRLIDEIDR